MASMKATKPQGSSPAAKVQQPNPGGTKPAPKKVVQKLQQPKVTAPKAAPQAKDAK